MVGVTEGVTVTPGVLVGVGEGAGSSVSDFAIENIADPVLL